MTVAELTAGRVLSAAFADDPMFVHVLPDPATREPRLQRLFAGSARHAGRHGGVEIVGEGGAVALWLHPAHMQIGPLAAARSSMLTLPLRVGPGAMGRLQRHEADALALVRRTAPGPFGYLQSLGADPRRRGSGLGRLAVEQTIDRMAAAGLPWCVLRTENERNVGLYRHLGFEDRASEVMAASGLRTWVFARPTGRGHAASGTL